ncbi:MAG: Fe-S protein assembly chaperone HscA, partial [Betaproteobacteria bacterium AqS2]|nr:Fe-S protein assembly chaperone HscA [Betaproteobacteria bacterium AqS2]
DEVVASVKRLMGRSEQDVADSYGFDYAPSKTMARLRAGGRELSPVEVSAAILRHLAEVAGGHFGKPPAAAVVTVPAYFDDSQRQATKDAAKLAGIEVLRLLNEPTAAALAYGLDEAPEGVYVVYDLGGGTFDVSVLRLRRGVFEVLATAGDTALGGDDYDRALAEHALAQAGLERPAGAKWRILLAAARAAKEKLTAETGAALEHEGQNIELGRDEFIKATQELTDRTLQIVKSCLADSGASGEVCGVIMVGGSVRMPQIAEAVAKLLDVPQHAAIDPDEVVALGAAAQADILAGNRAAEDGWVLLDVTPLSLGIETMGGLVEKIIPRNSAIPIARAQEFTTHQDGQGAMSIHVLQGERELARDCRSLARFTLRDLPPLPAGTARIRVTYQADADGIVTVEAREQTTGKSAAIEVKPSYGLDDEEVAAMLRAATEHAKEDVQARVLAEARAAAASYEAMLAAALRADAALAGDDAAAIEAGRKSLAAAAAGEDAAAIQAAVAALDKACEGFAQRRMDAAMAAALQGHKLD